MADLSYEKRGKVAWLRLCRPDQGNRLTSTMATELGTLAQVAEDDEDVQIVVLTGAGDVFCRGLAYAGEGAAAVQAIRTDFGELRCVEAFAALTKPSLAALNGDATGMGLELALACDLRLAVSSAQFGLPQVTEGLIPFCGGTQRLPRIVGQAKALELILTGALINATEAYRIGLVNTVIAPETLGSCVDELLTGLLGKGPIALRLGKEAVHKALDLTLDQGIRLEEDLYALLQTTNDRAEGIRAFMGKRRPTFTGR